MKTKTLAELQVALQDFLLDKTASASDLTLETPAFSQQERLQIYYDAYRLRLIDTLSNDYPALKNYVGESDFVALANKFIAKNPSHHPSLRWFGEKLPDFLREQDEYKNHIVLAELAEFEWAQVMVFDAASTYLATLDSLRALLPEQWMAMQIQFQPSLQRLNFYSNAPTLWESLIKNNVDVAPEISATPKDWLVWREELSVVYRPLGGAEAWALDSFLEQSNFADVCEGLCNWFSPEQVPMQAAQYLQHWVSSGLVENIAAE